MHLLSGKVRSAGRAFLQLTNTDDSYDTVGQSTYTFTTQSFGAAHADRQVIAAFYGQNAVRSHDSCTIGGISASADVNVADQGTTCSIWRASVPTGTTGTIVLNMGGGNGNVCGVGVWSLRGAASAVYDTASAINDDPSTTIDVPASGAILAFVGALTSASAPSGWVGVTQDFTRFQDSNHGYSGAHDEFANALTSRTISVSTNNTPGQTVLVAASYKPAF